MSALKAFAIATTAAAAIAAGYIANNSITPTEALKLRQTAEQKFIADIKQCGAQTPSSLKTSNAFDLAGSKTDPAIKKCTDEANAALDKAYPRYTIGFGQFARSF